MDIRAALEEAFSETPGQSSIVPTGTFASLLDAEFENAPGYGQDPAENHRKSQRRYAGKKKAQALERVAILDMETDPFDEIERTVVAPFAACLYAPSFEPVVIWEEDRDTFLEKLLVALEALEGEWTIYAHNGGRFDFMFLLSKLRGEVSFKGRGIMAAKIGRHSLRDSYHLIPEKLAAYKKEEFDYTKMKKTARNKHRQEIIDYLISDCVYLYEIVISFLTKYGFRISIGQAAMALLKQEYPECKGISEQQDEYLRGYFFGGRVECLGGRLDRAEDFKLYDVNSMYPYVMAHMRHPIGREYIMRSGEPGEHTFFVELECYSNGAFPIRGEEGGTHFPRAHGIYKVSIYEYKTALELGLIKDVRIIQCIDNEIATDFSKFILPLYENRLRTKSELADLKKKGMESTAEFTEIKKEDLFFKLLMNNAYGKFAQNPRRFREYYFTDSDARPPEEAGEYGEYPEINTADYAVWSRPIDEWKFNNVGTAASITGGARSVLMRAIHGAVEPIYCDTDSIICKSVSGIDIDKTKLGAWDCEAEINHIMIAGKKLYGYYKAGDKKPVIRAKGASNIKWENLKVLVEGGTITSTNRAPTLTRKGTQTYIERTLRSTITTQEAPNGNDC